MKQKVRKPRDFEINDHWFYPYRKQAKAIFYGHEHTLKELKRLHKWLGKAIDYLEQEKK